MPPDDKNPEDVAPVKRSTINQIFILLAAVLAFLSYMLKTDWNFKWEETRLWTGEVCKDVAVVIFSLALVDILWRRFGGDPLERHISEVRTVLDNTLIELRKTHTLLQQANTEGVVRIGSGHRNIGMPLLEFIKPVKKRIDMCGYTLHTVFQDGQAIDDLRDKIKAGAEMRVLISDPENRDIFDNIDPINSAPMQGQIHAVKNWLNQMRSQLDAEQQKRLEVRLLKRGKLTISILRFDEQALVSIYLRSKFIAETPSLIVEGGEKSLFKTFAKEFDYFFSQGLRSGSNNLSFRSRKFSP